MAFKYRHGDVLQVDHTPASAVSAGDVLDIGGVTFAIAHSDIPANTLGAVSLPNGSAVYEADVVVQGDTYTVGEVVEVDISQNAVVPAADAAGDGLFGRVVAVEPERANTVWVQPIPSLVDRA